MTTGATNSMDEADPTADKTGACTHGTELGVGVQAGMEVGVGTDVYTGADVWSSIKAGMDALSTEPFRSNNGSSSEILAGCVGVTGTCVEQLGAAASLAPAASAAWLAAAFFRQWRRSADAPSGGGREPSDSTLATMRSTMANASAGSPVDLK